MYYANLFYWNKQTCFWFFSNTWYNIEYKYLVSDGMQGRFVQNKMLYEAKVLKLAVNKFEVEAQVIWRYDVLLLSS